MQPNPSSAEILEVGVLSAAVCLIWIPVSLWQLFTKKGIPPIDAFRQNPRIVSTVTQVLLYLLWVCIFLGGIAAAALFASARAGKGWTLGFQGGTFYPFTAWGSAVFSLSIMFQVWSRCPWLRVGLKSGR
jgi:hypothetical protein